MSGKYSLPGTSTHSDRWITKVMNTSSIYSKFDPPLRSDVYVDSQLKETISFHAGYYRDGKKYTASQVSADIQSIRKTASWVGAQVHGLSGLRVPTLEGVEVAFVGDWIVKDEDGIVYIYTDEDFKSEFRKATSRDL